jgi:hypothetical protein
MLDIANAEDPHIEQLVFDVCDQNKQSWTINEPGFIATGKRLGKIDIVYWECTRTTMSGFITQYTIVQYGFDRFEFTNERLVSHGLACWRLRRGPQNVLGQEQIQR